MALSLDPASWILLFVGLSLLAAGVGELRVPGTWLDAVTDFEQHPGLRMLAGFVTIALGAAILFANPLSVHDRLSLVAGLFSALALVKGLLLLAAGDRFIRGARKLLTKAASFWAGTAALIGIILIFTAITKI